MSPRTYTHSSVQLGKRHCTIYPKISPGGEKQNGRWPQSLFIMSMNNNWDHLQVCIQCISIFVLQVENLINNIYNTATFFLTFLSGWTNQWYSTYSRHNDWIRYFCITKRSVKINRKRGDESSHMVSLWSALYVW